MPVGLASLGEPDLEARCTPAQVLGQSGVLADHVFCQTVSAAERAFTLFAALQLSRGRVSKVGRPTFFGTCSCALLQVKPTSKSA